jgi:hypothetical protein
MLSFKLLLEYKYNYVVWNLGNDYINDITLVNKYHSIIMVYINLVN